MEFVPKKLYYKIREVCEIVGVEAHVLRFWETEFSALSPPKSKSGQRTYRPKDIELLLRIRKLLYEEGYTIAGARKQLSVRNAVAPDLPSSAIMPAADSELLEEAAAERAPESGPEKEPPAAADDAADPAYAEAQPEEIEKVPESQPVAIKPVGPAEAAKEGKPPSERLKRVQAELENILTLLDRE